MNLKGALRVAKNFVIYGEPDGDYGSFEPIKAFYEDEVWEVTCRYTKDEEERIAKVEIDDSNREIISFELITESDVG